MDFKEFTRNFLIAGAISLAFITIVSILINQFFPSFPILKSGSSFLIMIIGIALSVLYLAAYDKQLNRGEITIWLLIVVVLAGSYWALLNYAPQIFSSISPDSTKQIIFSAFGG